MKALEKTAVVALSALALAAPVMADALTAIQPSEPATVAAVEAQPYEVVPGTHIPLVLIHAAPALVIAQVSTDVFDFHRNVAIPKGSRLIGKELRKVNERREVVWIGLQIPAASGTLRLDPPLQATMRDGSAGVVDLTPGALLGAMTSEPFIVPH
ncbi:TrbI/VirB10 family protein [Ralstonia solanacearum]|uniref:TrbI/VirB10 family protein n=1 Tax=Ralstonia solanacearum TaxID=305 RepID=UPI00070F8F47|nr:TrbI/VirB10 family protein [Ralstonia solanacearum]ATJ89159.1 conjugal transfer protein [Ralstonia solanacearum]MDB0529536.1 TrbI/VirB10 family protein [Ralstonia solanacearum]MDB0568265.1 TrbI/VirB10 family protein [Ralstonia solanacearum]MDB0576758.1 TrbI/VirB10 family protein [Ralstonia solanacearum]OAI58599.1 conjugal transfer protein [Ralstonia solanacearum]